MPKKPQTYLQPIQHILRWGLRFLFLAYLGLLLLPQLLFTHSVSAVGITLYARQPLPAEAIASLNHAANLVHTSELAVPGRSERIFLCNSQWLFRLFSPVGTPFAVSMPFTDYIFIASADVSRDIANRYAPDFNTRSLASVIAHEITHGLIRERLGLWQAIRLPDWINEGYCDYVAFASSFPETEGLRLIISDQRHLSPSFQYFKYRQMVRYLIDVQGLSFAAMAAQPDTASRVETQTREWLRQLNSG